MPTSRPPHSPPGPGPAPDLLDDEPVDEDGTRPSVRDITPIPDALPHHIADPTQRIPFPFPRPPSTPIEPPPLREPED